MSTFLLFWALKGPPQYSGLAAYRPGVGGDVRGRNLVRGGCRRSRFFRSGIPNFRDALVLFVADASKPATRERCFSCIHQVKADEVA